MPVTKHRRPDLYGVLQHHSKGLDYCFVYLHMIGTRIFILYLVCFLLFFYVIDYSFYVISLLIVDYKFQWIHSCLLVMLNVKTCLVGDIDETPHYQFGQHSVGCQQVFYKTALSFAFINIKPVLPGRILRKNYISHTEKLHKLYILVLSNQLLLLLQITITIDNLDIKDINHQCKILTPLG